MGELIKQVQLGDITFGVPGDIYLLNSSWGFYEFLGVERGASLEQIRVAYRRLAKKLHPDIGGDEEAFKRLRRVVEILLDDGKELGTEHSQRRHYDEVSSLDESFDEFITFKDERTKRLSEIILIQMRLRRWHAEAEQELGEKYPRFAELRAKLRRARSEKSKGRIASEMQEIADREYRVTQEMREENRKGFIEEQKRFIRAFSGSAEDYMAKVADIFHVGGGDITFGPPHTHLIRFGLVSHKNGNQILELVLAGDCYIAGFPQVHFKSEKADVTITDPNITGIFHIINGNIMVDYSGVSYGGVVRARAPNLRILQGFVQRGELLTPERFATRNWWRKKQSLDLAIREGGITLQLRSQKFDTTPTSSLRYDRLYDLEKRIVDNSYINKYKL